MFGNNSKNQKRIAELLKEQGDFNFDKAGIKNRLMLSVRDSKLRAIPARVEARHWKFKFAGILAVIAVCSSGLVYADGAKPGDKLYFLDLMEENVRMNIPQSSTAKAELQSEIINERLEEIDRLPVTDAKSETLKLETIKNVQDKLIQAVDDTSATKTKLEQKGKLKSVEKVNSVLESLEKTAGKEEDRMEESKKTEDADAKDTKSEEQIKQETDWQARIDAIKKARLKARLEGSGSNDKSDDQTDKQETEPSNDNKDNPGSVEGLNIKLELPASPAAGN